LFGASLIRWRDVFDAYSVARRRRSALPKDAGVRGAKTLTQIFASLPIIARPPVEKRATPYAIALSPADCPSRPPLLRADSSAGRLLYQQPDYFFFAS